MHITATNHSAALERIYTTLHCTMERGCTHGHIRVTIAIGNVVMPMMDLSEIATRIMPR
jgi:hypothetical protein